MLRDDEVKDLVTTTPEEGIGNSYATQFRLYDTRTTRWFSLDPLKSKFPWSSPYVGMGNNPVIYTDPNGDYYWNANHNSKLVKSMSTNISTKNVTSTKSDSELNKIADIWQNKNGGHYAPKVAEYVKDINNSIPVIQGIVKNTAADGFVAPNIPGRPIGINYNSNNFKSSLFHETIHNMGYDKEFDAYSSQLAANYYQDFITNLVEGSIVDYSSFSSEQRELQNLRNHIIWEAENYAIEKGTSIYSDEEKKNGEKIRTTDTKKVLELMKQRGSEIIGNKEE